MPAPPLWRQREHELNYYRQHRFTLRQVTTFGSYVCAAMVFVVITLQIVHLLSPDDFQHPSTSHDLQPLKPDEPAVSKDQQLSILSKAQPPDLFLSYNEPFSARSVRITNPANVSLNHPPPLVSNKNSRRFSHFRCAGDDNDIDRRGERICVFENVCYNLQHKQWNYFVRPDTQRKPILFDMYRGERFDFWEEGLGFVALSGFTQGSTDWAPIVQTMPSPAYVSPSTTITLQNLHAIFHLAVHDDNLGHLLWEEMGMLWYSMIRLNAYSTDLIAMHAVNPLPDRKLNKKFRNAFFKAFTPNDPVNLEEYIFAKAKSGTSPSEPAIKDVCFDQLLAGGNMLRLRNRILSVHGIDWTKTPVNHRIVFTNKTETLKKNIDGGLATNRGISNLAEIVTHVKKRYPSVKVDVIEWQKLGIKEQLELLQSTTLLITPSGGVSTLLPFLPEGAHAIIVDYYERTGDPWYGTQPKTSVSMEAPMWNHFPHVKKLYYQVWGAADLVSDVPGKTVEEVDWRYEVSTKINLGRLDKLIEAGFEDMEP
ncbi:UNVERIFIED_CONTAM: hypothetical protein HDU68_002070 [Siphonaria sp. JEL0065]|nr:hypothetical protein HDU68_002070 [Siphonaria sp. JEL0065]